MKNINYDNYSNGILIINNQQKIHANKIIVKILHLNVTSVNIYKVKL